MQRGLDAETKQQLEEDQRRIISDEHWYLDLPELKAKEWVVPVTRPRLRHAAEDLLCSPSFRNLIIEERSYVPFEDLIYGRMSFQGFNPEVEVSGRFLSRDRRVDGMVPGCEGEPERMSSLRRSHQKLMALINPKSRDEEEEEEEKKAGMQTDVTDQEMALR